MTTGETTISEGPFEEKPVQEEREQIEIDLLLEGIHRLYGYDFRNYAMPSLRRRILHHVDTEHVNSISELQHKVLMQYLMLKLRY